MDYFYTFQHWFGQTDLYQNVLRDMPAPLDNVNFDILIIVGCGVYLVYRMAGKFWILLYHRKVRRKQADAIRMQKEQDASLKSRERKVQEQEERIGTFMDCMAVLFDCMRNGTESQQNQQRDGKKALGFRNFLLEKKERSHAMCGAKMTEKSEYDVAMEDFESEEQLEEKVNRTIESNKEKVISRLKSLENDFALNCVDVPDILSQETINDPENERKKARARRIEEKEQKKVERRLNKKVLGARNGRNR